MSELVFPRLIYRGEPDTLGLGIGETKRVNSQDEWEQAQKEGWRLTSHIEAPKAKAKDEKPAKAKDEK